MSDGISIIKKRAKIKHKQFLTENIYRMSFETDLCYDAKPGQFIMAYPPDGSRLLGRPFCIADAAIQECSIVFRAVGGGTREIASLDAGDELMTEGPLGRGYPFDDALTKGKRIVLLGGGLGAPSLLFLAKRLAEARQRRGGYETGGSISAILGYRDSSLRHFLANDFKELGTDTIIATDDGSEGIRGNVLEALEETGIKPDIIYACGPLPMLSAVKRYVEGTGVKAYISLEEHMACGVGVCLGCVVKTVEKDAHSHVNNARICTEGPVFEASEVVI